MAKLLDERVALELRFTLERETKNTYRFQEAGEGEEHIIGTLYVQKGYFNGSHPKEVTINLEWK